MENRKIRRVLKSKPVIEGAGVYLKRAIGFPELPQFDPFLLLDDFRSGKPEDYLSGFPWHPHRGIETITYMLDGNVEHGDSLGNSGVIAPGDVQWMTAGSGVIHQEMPKGDKNGVMGGFQLWANLPATHKMMDPRYRDVKSSTIPVAELDNGIKVKVISGMFNEIHGPVTDIVTDPSYFDITVPPDSAFDCDTLKGHTVFAYVIEGGAYFCGEKKPFSFDAEGGSYYGAEWDPFISNGSVVLFGDGDRLNVETKDKEARFLLLSGKPIGEPIAWYGPIVMNTGEELETAFSEYRNGTFLKVKKAG